MKLNYGIIGTGMMGCEHIRNLSQIPEANVIAIADPNENSRQWGMTACGDRFKPTQFSDYKELLKRADIDVVIVASPNFTHIDVMRDVFETDKHVLLEKPMCTNLADGLEVLSKEGEKIENKILKGENDIKITDPVDKDEPEELEKKRFPTKR